MERDDWASRWSEGRIAFHQTDVSDYLELYASRVLAPGTPARVLVPLCGKSLDMVFFADRGAEVVGVEYVEQAVREFFAERGLEPALDAEPLPRFSAGGYTLFAADFFDVTSDLAGPVDVVFDRAALVALDPPARVRYAAHLRELLRPGAAILLITFEYEQAEMEGPPFAVLPDEVHNLFGEGFSIEHLATRDILSDRFRDRLSAMREAAYLITRGA